VDSAFDPAHGAVQHLGALGLAEALQGRQQERYAQLFPDLALPPDALLLEIGFGGLQFVMLLGSTRIPGAGMWRRE